MGAIVYFQLTFLMRQTFVSSAWLLILTLVACSRPSLEQLQSLGPTESFAADTFLSQAQPQRAMVIVAHDDDACGMMGTVALLHASGWEIRGISFRTGDSARDERQVANAGQLMSEVAFIELDGPAYRNDLDTVTYPYMPIPHEGFEAVFNRARVAKEVIREVRAFRPTVIFTLDDEMGGYGHPDHIFISRLVRELAEADSIPVQRIYQGVYTDHMEYQIVEVRLTKRLGGKWPSPYLSAKEMYGLEGMPAPTVEVDITAQAEAKMNYLRGYQEAEKRNLRKFLPYFEDFDAATYFSVFDREFFRVLVVE